MTDDIDVGAWFAFYPGDFTRDTMHLTAEEVGVYLRLLCHQWSRGSIPDDLERLARITQADHQVIAEITAEYFPGGRNRRLEEERQRAQSKRKKARESALKRWQADPEPEEEQQSDRNANAYADAMLPPPPPPPQSDSQSQPSPATRKQPRCQVSDEMWERFKSTYPERQGNQYWAKAREKAEQLLKAGVDWAEIMAGARRYRAQAEATGRVGTEFIKQAQFWLTPKEQLWTEEYPLPAVQPGRRQASVSAAQEWLNQPGDDHQ